MSILDRGRELLKKDAEAKALEDKRLQRAADFRKRMAQARARELQQQLQDPQLEVVIHPNNTLAINYNGKQLCEIWCTWEFPTYIDYRTGEASPRPSDLMRFGNGSWQHYSENELARFLAKEVDAK